MDENTTQSILQRLTRIETLLEVDVKNLDDRVDKDYKNIDARISKIEGTISWVIKTLGVSILGLIIGAITITFR